MKKWLTIFIVSIVGIGILYIGFLFIFPPQSQERSRILGMDTKLEIPKDCKTIINITFSVKNSKTHKYLTYVNKKGELVTKEYRDWGFLEGQIRWVGFKESMIK